MKTGNLDGQGLAELQNYRFQNSASAPTTNLGAGRYYFDTAEDTLKVKTANRGWLDALSQGTTYTFSTGLTNTSGTVTLNVATASTLGGVIAGSNISIGSDGTISVADASTSAKGLIEIATDTEVSTGTDTSRAVTPKQLAGKVNKLSTAPTSGTYTKVTINGDGLVTSGSSLQASDIPSLTLSKISDVTATASEVNVLDGITASTSELNILDGVTVTASDINSVTSKLNKKPDGTNDLIDTNNKITTGYIPDFILGQLLYAGTFAPSTAVATLSTNAKTKLGTTSNTITLTNNTTAITGYAANEGCYYICSGDGTFASISFVTGDWLVSTGSAWKKIDNTDAVTGVKGNAESTYRTGNINITADNVLPTQTNNSGKFLSTNGTTASWATVPDTLPTQTGNSGKYLTTNGTTASWATVDALPSQTSNSGKFLTTNGTSASWSSLVYTTTNTALTQSGGKCTWSVTHNLGSNVTVQVFEVSSGSMVIPNDITLTSSTVATIELLSASNISANTYKVVVTGVA